MDSKFNFKSYGKAKTVRKLMRNQIFERNRQIQTPAFTHYLKFYPESTQLIIRQSLQCQIPQNVSTADLLASLGPITRQNISLYRRVGKPAFKTQMDGQNGLDPHMTYESLWGLAGVQNIEGTYDNYQKIIKQFQDNLSNYLALPFPQIKQMAIIAAGNKVIGKQDDIVSIVSKDLSQIWILINHIYERKIPFLSMYPYLRHQIPIVYKTIYQMTNNQKDEIIESIMKQQVALENIIGGLNRQQQNADIQSSLQIKLYCVRIIGNILAERDAYYEIFMKYQILDRISELLKNCGSFRETSSDQLSIQKRLKHDIKKDLIWLLSNYICDTASANSVLCKPGLLQKILLLFKNQTAQAIKFQVYHVIAYLAFYGDRHKIYQIALQQKFLQECCIDIQSQGQDLTLIILNLVSKLVQIGEEFADQVDFNERQRNPFIYFILCSKLKSYIHEKTYNQNIQISNISFSIMDKVEEYEAELGDMDQDM